MTNRFPSFAAMAAALMLAAPAHAAQGFTDSIAQRMQACTECHGAEGRAGPDGYYPRIAGKPAGYLYNQLLNFRDGRRQYAIMTRLLDPLSDAYLKEIAEYFSGLDLPYPPSAPATAGSETLERGRRLVMEGDAARRIPACVACHGTAMTGVAPAIPGLLGLPRDYLAGQLGAFRAGARKAQAPDCMRLVADRLSSEDIGAVTQYLSSHPVPADSHPAARLQGSLPMPCGGVPGPVAEGAVDETIPSVPPGTPPREAASAAAAAASISSAPPRRQNAPPPVAAPQGAAR